MQGQGKLRKQLFSVFWWNCNLFADSMLKADYYTT